MSKRTVEILLVEDNPGDADLIKEALGDWNQSARFNIARDGVECLDYLRQMGKFAHASPPDLILMDLNLPRKDGREVLQEIKSDPKFRHIPVIVLTTSEADRDISESYRLGANCYLSKPLGFHEFSNLVQGLGNFWLSLVKLPSEGRPQ